MEFVQLFDRERIETRVRELGREISAHYGDEPLVCVCVLKGAYVFFADLMRALSIHPVVDFVRLSSYADQTSRSRMIFSKDLEVDIRDKCRVFVRCMSAMAVATARAPASQGNCPAAI